ncbi:MAG: hypothetical protein K0B02_02835 [DPANN group archaeon]|nr:hypothetical protein [DPANN group archaeon]
MAIFRWIYNRFNTDKKQNLKDIKDHNETHKKHHEDLVNVISQGFSIHKNKIDSIHNRMNDLENRPHHVVTEKILQPQYIKVQDSEQLIELENMIRNEILKINSNISDMAKNINILNQEKNTTELSKEVHHLYKKIDNIENRLQTIIPNEKIDNITHELNQIKTDFNQITKDINEKIDVKLKKIEDNQKKINDFKYETNHIVNIQPINDNLYEITEDSLTDAQKKALIIIIALSGESKTNKAANEDIIKEMYPQHKVEDRRSTVANYIRELEKIGLISREKKGRNTFISATDKAHELIDNHKNKTLLRKKKMIKQE